MAGHLHLQLCLCASAIVVDSNISYCQMLLSRDTVGGRDMFEWGLPGLLPPQL